MYRQLIKRGRRDKNVISHSTRGHAGCLCLVSHTTPRMTPGRRATLTGCEYTAIQLPVWLPGDRPRWQDVNIQPWQKLLVHYTFLWTILAFNDYFLLTISIIWSCYLFLIIHGDLCWQIIDNISILCLLFSKQWSLNVRSMFINIHSGLIISAMAIYIYIYIYIYMYHCLCPHLYDASS